MSTTRHDIGDPKTRPPKLHVRNRTSSSDVGVHSSANSIEISRSPPSIASTTDRPSSDHSHIYWTPDLTSSASSVSSASTSEAAKPQSKRSVFKFLSLKEPSASAWEQFSQQQKAEAAIRGHNAAGMSHKKLPSEVPKVNSKWDGMPKVASEKKGTGSSIKRSTDSSRKRSDDPIWGTSTSSTRQSSSSKRATDWDESRTNKSSSSTLRAPASQGRSYSDRSPRSSSLATRPHGTSHDMRAWSTTSLTPDGGGPADWSTFSEMPLHRPYDDHLDDEQPAAPGLAESESIKDASDSPLKSFMPNLLGSDDSSPVEPRTPEDDYSLIPSDSAKMAPPPAYSPRRESLPGTEREWRNNPNDFSERPSIPSTSPPPIPSRSARRTPSANPLQNARIRTVDDATGQQLDGVANVDYQDRLPQASSPHQESSSAAQREARNDIPQLTSAKSSEDDHEADGLDASDVPRSRSGSGASQTMTRPHLNFSRPRSTGRSSIDSFDSTPSTPISTTSPNTTHTPFRSFSRPLPMNAASSPSSEQTTSSSQSRTNPASSMGTLSIVRHNMPIYPASNSVFVPPRFQPGRAIIKDSDLDTIAETDSLCSRRSYASTIGFDVDIPRGRSPNADSIPSRGSYASTIDADVPRGRTPLHDVDGASDDTAENYSDSESLRSSLDYTSSEGTVDPYVPAFPAHSFESNHSSLQSSNSSSTQSALQDDDEDDLSDDTETELDYATVRKHQLRQEPSAHSLAPSVASATSVLSARWSRTPQERLGLGGRVRKSVGSMPWDEHTHGVEKRVNGGSGGANKVNASAPEGFDLGGEKGVTAGDMKKLLGMFRKG